MTNTITINNQDIRVKDYQGQRVVTFSEIDKVHGKKNNSARVAFNRHKKRFVEGKDYFVSDRYEAQTKYNLTAPNGLTLITESGYYLLAKVFDDDPAWNIQRMLVDTYFHAKAEQLPITEPYQYQPKTFRGEQVVTFRDLEYLTQKPKHTLEWTFRTRIKKFRLGVDYWLLKGKDLSDFKDENHLERTGVSSLYIISKSGFQRLGRLLQHMPKSLPCFSLPVLTPKPEPEPKKTRVAWVNEEQANHDLHMLYNKAAAFIEIINMLQEPHTEDQHHAFIDTIQQFSLKACVDAAAKLPKIPYILVPAE